VCDALSLRVSLPRRSEYDFSSDAGIAAVVEHFLLYLNSFPARHVDGLSGAFVFHEGKRGGARPGSGSGASSGAVGLTITCHVCQEKVLFSNMQQHMRELHPSGGDGERRTAAGLDSARAKVRTSVRPCVCVTVVSTVFVVCDSGSGRLGLCVGLCVGVSAPVYRLLHPASRPCVRFEQCVALRARMCRATASPWM
jgi:hypothetical protein